MTSLLFFSNIAYSLELIYHGKNLYTRFLFCFFVVVCHVLTQEVFELGCVRFLVIDGVVIFISELGIVL